MSNFAFDDLTDDEFDDLPTGPAPKEQTSPGQQESKGGLKVGTLALIISGVLVVLVFLILAGRNYLVNNNTSEGKDISQVETTRPTQQAQGTAKKEQQALKRVAEPEVSETFEAVGAVTNKYTVQFSGSVFYTLDITISKNGNSRVFQYFTSKDVYDGMNIGTNVNVVYTGDSEGNFILISITK